MYVYFTPNRVCGMWQHFELCCCFSCPLVFWTMFLSCLFMNIQLPPFLPCSVVDYYILVFFVTFLCIAHSVEINFVTVDWIEFDTSTDVTRVCGLGKCMYMYHISSLVFVNLNIEREGESSSWCGLMTFIKAYRQKLA